MPRRVVETKVRIIAKFRDDFAAAATNRCSSAAPTSSSTLRMCVGFPAILVSMVKSINLSMQLTQTRCTKIRYKTPRGSGNISSNCILPRRMLSFGAPPPAQQHKTIKLEAKIMEYKIDMPTWFAPRKMSLSKIPKLQIEQNQWMSTTISHNTTYRMREQTRSKS